MSECRECGVELGAGYLCDGCDGRIAETDPDMVAACPECDDASIVHSKQSSLASDEEAYRCTACGHHFEEPTERPSQSSTDSLKGLAKQLHERTPTDPHKNDR